MTDKADPFDLDDDEDDFTDPAMFYPGHDNVPRPPREGFWIDVLRWAIFVMDDDDEDAEFVAEKLLEVVKTGQIAADHARMVIILERVMRAYGAQELECQSLTVEEEDDMQAALDEAMSGPVKTLDDVLREEQVNDAAMNPRKRLN